MASSFEKSVKGATKIKNAPPKSKYIEHILVATHTGEAGVAEVFRALQNRLRDSTWTVVFKSLIVVHLLIREGAPEVALRYLSNGPQRKLALSNFTEVQTQGKNIKTYAEYLLQRAVSYEHTKIDYVLTAQDGRLKKLSVEKGLLRETEALQDQIRALLRCDFFSQDPENDITLTAFRFLTLDLISLYYVMNEGTVNVIEHFLEMSKPDAQRAVAIYKTFCKQTDKVVNYLAIARQYEHATRLEIPKMKHAPTNLISSMDEYLKDPDFETNRRQYLAEQQNKKKGGANGGSSKPAAETKSSSAQPSSQAFGISKPPAKPDPFAVAPAEMKAPKADLIDFFESIEQNQQPMMQSQYQPQQQFQQQGMPAQATGFPQQMPFGVQMTGAPSQQSPFSAQMTGVPNQIANGQGTNPFLQMQQQVQSPPIPQPLQTNFTGAGFGGYTPQPQQNTGFSPSLSSIPQSGIPNFTPNSAPASQQQFANSPVAPSPAGTNPFRQSMLASTTGTTVSSFGSTPTGSTVSTFPSTINRQSTNPFAKPSGTPPQSSQPFSAPTSQPMFTSQPSQPFTQQPFSPQTSLPFSPQTSQPGPFNLQPTSQPSPFAPQPTAQPLMPAQTGTNPFAHAMQPPSGTPPPGMAPVTVNATGSTNPFRQSQFVNQQTGQGWQQGPQGTIGGYGAEQFGTTSIFPRPGQQQQQQ